MAQKVIVYTTEGCPYCSMLKDFLKENKVKYESIDVGKHPEKIDEMVSKSGQMGVPVIEIDGKVIMGFDREAISAELGIM